MSSSSTGGAGGASVLPWTKQLGSADTDALWGIAEDPLSNTTIQVVVKKPIDFGSGPLVPNIGRNIALAKFDAAGGYLWSKLLPNTYDADPRELCDDGLGNLYIVGNMEGVSGGQDFGGPTLPEACSTNLFIAKLNPSGDHLWSKVYVDCSAQGIAEAAVDPSHNLLLVGANEGTFQFDTGPIVAGAGSSALVAKIAPNGTGIWAKNFGVKQGGWGIAAAPNGNVVMVGFGTGAIDFGGKQLSPIWPNQFMGWVAELDPNGNYLWARAFNSDHSALYGVEPQQVAVDSQGNVIVAGAFDDACDFGGGSLQGAGPGSLFLAKYDSTGAYAWSRSFPTTGGAGPSPLHAIATSPTGDFWLQGAFYDSVQLGANTLSGSAKGDFFLARFDSGGTAIWSQASSTMGPAGAGAWPAGIAIDANGSVAVGATFGGTMKLGAAFGGAQLVGSTTDLFVGKF
jgi:hypothetical protein